MKKRWMATGMSLVALCCCSGCTPQSQQTGAAAGQVTEAGMQNTEVRVNRYPFPTGARITSRSDIAATLRNQPYVSTAVVIESDNQAYVAVRPYKQPLSSEQVNAIVKDVKRFDLNVHRVLVTSKPDAYADFENYSRYLNSGRTVGGMLLAWRSIVRKTWGTNNLSGS
jgi:hypothetical protein